MSRSAHQSESLLQEITRRVILVGRTGIDQQLRKDSKTEIVRAPDALTAVGELSDPPEGLESARPVVVVGLLPVTPDPAGSAQELVEAMRRVEPRVLVLGTLGAHERDQYDSTLDPNASTERLIASIESARPRRHQRAGLEVEPEASETDPRSSVAPSGDPVLDEERSTEFDTADAGDANASGPEEDSAFGPAIAQESAEHGRAGEVAARDEPTLISALLRGKCIRDAALEIIGKRLGTTVELSDVDPDQPENPMWAPVMLGENPVAWLGDTAGKSTPRLLADQADWLSAWMRLERQQRDLRIAAFTDPLTGAWNRRYFDRYLTATFDQARLSRLPVTVMVFDIDNFKQYNDRFGHGAGDEILCQTVDLLRSCIRPTDRVCRIGGDEFAVIFYEPEGPRSSGSAPPVSIYNIAMRFQRQICEHRFPKLGDQLEGTLTVSGGLATFPWDGTTPEALLNRADELSLESKHAGKNVLTLGAGAQRECQAFEPDQSDMDSPDPKA